MPFSQPIDAARRRSLHPVVLCVLIFAALMPDRAAARATATVASGWRFLRGDPSGAAVSDTDDTGWGAVTLPHTWNADDGRTSQYYRGVGWYRNHLSFAQVKPGDRAYLRFGAASLVADVYVNGVWVGHHDGGFTAFTFDVTDQVAPGSDNLVAVKVSNAFNRDVAPVDADFTFFGGLYRDVELIVTGPTHISLLDHGALGVYAQVGPLAADQATVKVSVVLANDGAAAAPEVRLAIADRDGRVVAHASFPVTLPAGASRTVASELLIAAPHLWDGQRDPYLYHLTAELYAPGLGLLDGVTTTFGVRSISVSPEGGLTLNGKHLALRGVNMHQDWAGKGWALGDAERRATIEILQDMGANAVRLCHYPHSPNTLDRLDAAGIIAWSEVPLVNTVTPSAAFAASTKEQLVEMIRQLGNHPAIAFWGLYNEVKADPIGLVDELNKLAHAEDPSRLTTAASDRPLGFPLHVIPDTLALNKYDGWYYRGLDDFGLEMDAARAAYPSQGLGVSEYGAGANITQHQEPGSGVTHTESFHPEEAQSSFHESYLDQLATRPYMFGHFIWNLFDFASATRHEGGSVGLNDKGLVTYDRGVKKDAYFLYKASWSAEPVLYITSRRYTERTDAATSLKVYSNLATLNVHMGSVLLGPPTRHAGVVWEWDGLTLPAGVTRVTAEGDRGGMALADSVTWTLAP